MNDWHLAGVQCPSCRARSTWCAPKVEAETHNLEYICVACNGQFYMRDRSFHHYTSYAMLSEWDQQRVRMLRVVAGCGGNSAVGAFR